MRYLKIFLPSIVVVFYYCSEQVEQNAPAFEVHIVNDMNVLISAESSGFIAKPTHVKAYDGAVYFVDAGYHRITKVNKEGEKLLSFGSYGRGPGEFDIASGPWVFDGLHMVYDYNGFKFIIYDQQGDLVEEKVIEKNPVNPDGFPPNIPLSVHAISPDELLIPSSGKNGSLFAHAKISTGKIQFIGDALSGHVESYQNEKVQDAYKKGEIPEISKNGVMLENSSSGIYAFQRITGKLQKFSYSGALLWEKSLKLPVQEKLFVQIAEKNIERGDRDRMPTMFTYAWSIDANDHGVAVLLNMPDQEPLTVAWVPDDGTGMDVIIFREFNELNIQFPGLLFTVSLDNQRVYFVDYPSGTIYQAEWPI